MSFFLYELLFEADDLLIVAVMFLSKLCHDVSRVVEPLN